MRLQFNTKTNSWIMLPLEIIKKIIQNLNANNKQISKYGHFSNDRFSYYGLMFSPNKVELINLYQSFERRGRTKKTQLKYFDVTNDFIKCQHEFVICIKKIRSKYKNDEKYKSYIKNY